MAKINVVTPTNLGKSFRKDIASKKFEVNVDNSTIKVNEQGQLVVKSVDKDIITAGDLDRSQLIIENANETFSRTELYEYPATVSGMGQYVISEVTGWDDVEITGKGYDKVALLRKEYGENFLFNHNKVHILQLDCDVYEISEDLSVNKTFDINTPKQDKNLIIRPNENGKKTEIKINLLLSLYEKVDVKRKYRIFYKLRVAGQV